MGQNNSKRNSDTFEQYSIKNVQNLISRRKDINTKNYNNETFLHFACQNQNENPIEIIKNLIEKGIDINAKTKDNEQTSLHYACKSLNPNSLEIIKYLIEKGSDVNAKTKENQTPLHFACLYQNSIEVIKYLVSKGADVNARKSKFEEETPLHFVCKTLHHNSIEIIKFLVSKGADVNVKTKEHQQTALHYACESQYQNQSDKKDTLEVVEFLIENGADANAKNINQETPLHLICKNENKNSVEIIFTIIQLLVSKGADVNVKTKDSEETALHLVCANQNENPFSFDMIKFLVENGAEINTKQKNGKLPLHLICEMVNQTHNQNSFEIVKFLVSKGADINTKSNFYEQTPLHLVCGMQNINSQSIEIIKFLVENGADINSTNQYKQSPLISILQSSLDNLLELLEFLVSKGADVNVKNYNNETLLHLNCQFQKKEKSIEIAKFLVSKGLDVNAKSNSNYTPLSFAIQKNNPKLIQFLLMNDANPSDLTKYKLSKQILDSLNPIYSINQDLNNLLKSNEDNFSDFEIQSNDYFKFKVHKLILLTRFDNDESILSKFIETCSQKSKEEVEIALNFIYTGFPDFDEFFQQIKDKIDNNKNQQDISIYSDYRDDPSFYLSFYSGAYMNQENQNQNEKESEKEKEIKQFFQEIGFDSNWIESKKGRKGIIKDLSKLYQQNETKDFTIICDNEKEIKVHKLILILRSELYKGMFLSVNDSSNQVHDYSGKSLETIHQLIYFLYHDKFDKTKQINFKIIEEFEDLKDYYQLNQNSIIDLILKDLI